MSGTVVIARGISSDMRTIDFLEIVEAMRSKGYQSVVAKVLEPLDKGGVNMMQMDQLDSTEFKQVAQLMREICRAYQEKASDSLSMYLENLCVLIEQDARCI